jgi:uncharacterized membrane protein YccC
MIPTFIGEIIFVAVSILCAVLFHYSVKRPVMATFFAALTAATVFQFLSGPDPSIAYAIVPSFAIAFVIALLVGIPFVYWRRKARD